MANDKVSIWGDTIKFGRSPASGDLLVGNGSGFDLTTSNVIWGNPIEFTVPIKVDGQVWSTTTGFKFPDGTVQATAASSYSPPSVANNTIISNVSGGTASPAANTLTQVLNSTASSTQGTLLYRSASSWTALAPGTAGQALITGGTGADPSWGSATPWTTIKKTTDQLVTAVGDYVDDNQLYFSMSANSVYAIRGVYILLYGSQLACNGPTGTLNFSSTYNNTTAITAYDTSVFMSGSGPFLFAFNITVAVGGTGGTFVMRLIQNVSGSGVNFPKGSYIEYMKVV